MSKADRSGKRKRWIAGMAGAITVTVLMVLASAGAPQLPVSPWGAQEAKNLELVGHSPLEHRGMNTALALNGDTAYIGYRADGTHPEAGVLVVDVSDPSDPTVADRIGEPHHAQPGESSRELRIWPQAGLLIVLDIPCDAVAHACYNPQGATPDAEYEIYDITGENAHDPQHVATYTPQDIPHEFYLWIDPDTPSQRALLVQSTPHGDHGELLVADISDARAGTIHETATWDGDLPGSLHSVSLSPDGTRGYLSHSEGGVLVLDTTDLAEGAASPTLSLVTDPDQRAHWGAPGTHSAVKVPGRDIVWTTDESYGWYVGLGRTPVAGDFSSVITGCPWTWARIIDISDPVDPEVTSSFKIDENREAFCQTPEGKALSNTTSMSSHNPTVTPDLAINTWYGGGVRVADITDPSSPTEIARFVPAPLPAVATEDPAVTQGPHKVGMWSYPVIQDGLIYVVDIRNGLYVLDYTGPHEDQVDELAFLEGNSNRGDADRWG